MLGVTESYFFEDMADTVAEASPACLVRGALPGPQDEAPSPLTRRETLEFVRAFGRIEDARSRGELMGLINALSAGPEIRQAAE